MFQFYIPGWVIFITLIIVLLLMLIWTWAHDRTEDTPEIEKYETPAEADYDLVFGYEDTPESRKALQTALKRERQPNPPAQNAFIIGDLLEFNYDNHDVALMYYQDAVDRLLEDPEDYYADHILNRIEDVVAEIDTRPARDVVRAVSPKLKDGKVIAIKPDPQNVHDSHVNDDLRKIYHKIVQNNMLDDTPPVSRDDLVTYLKSTLSPNKLRRAQKTLAAVDKAGNNSAVGAHENQIIDEVWQRINSRENEDRQNELKESLADALIDATDESGYTVCSNGRCARVLSSLTLLDTNPDVAAPVKTREILRSEVMSKASKIIETAIDNLPGGVDYADGKESPEVTEFETTVKNKIAEIIVADYPEENTKYLADLVLDAQAGV